MKAFKFTSILSSSLSKNLTVRTIRSAFSDKMRDKEQAEERFYFDKEERRLAQELLNKLRKDKKNKPIDDETFKQRERLSKLLESHREKFSEALIDDIVAWKKDHH